MFITVKQFAEQRNISGRYVRRLIQDGKITRESWKQGKRGYLIDPAKADQDMGDNIIGWAETGPGDHVVDVCFSMSRTEALVMQACYRAALLKLEYEQRSAELVEAALVETERAAFAQMVLDAILELPPRLAPVIAEARDPHFIHKLLTETINSALTELSEAM